jgi:hypothetical protein
MNQAIFTAAFASFIPASAILFRWKGPRAAVPICLFAGFLLLPRGDFEQIVPHVGSWINKQTVSGLALLVGILVSDPRTLLRARPRALDIPMVAFVLLPLASFAANAFEEPWVALSVAWMNFAGWSLPYLAGRLYFGDGDGPRRLSRAIVVAGLLSTPIFAFEMIAGPRYYLSGLVYGISPRMHMVERLGGWRPEGFQSSGLEVAAWLALSATMAVWCRLRGAWPSRRDVAWLPTTVLVLATIVSRGVYGYLNLALGLTTAAFTHLARSRILMIALAIVPPAYIGSRISGAWDGKALVEMLRFTGRADTVEYRLRAEEQYIKKVVDHNLAFGFGGRNSAIFDWWARSHLWPDGWWVNLLRSGGLVGLSAAFLALFLFPAGLALTLPADRSGRASPASMAWGLALFVILHMVDSVQNMNFLNVTPLVGGSLVGLFAARRSTRLLEAPAGGFEKAAGKAESRLPLLITAVVLAGVEVLGRLPRTPAPTPTAPAPEAAAPAQKRP